ncbi:ABC transporter ATP-binding protein [Gammaproteobacteria bacterium]|nr:ABC transporter ATP-binding protein [Gammaproteobacteria bacterium]
MTSLISCSALNKSFKQLGQFVPILKNISLDIATKESIAIMGSSGSGKSTLLSLLGGLDTPNSGVVNINGVNLSKCTARELNNIRNKSIGFVYQMHHLLGEFTAAENVAMPMLIGGYKKNIALDKAHMMLAKVSLTGRFNYHPHQLSGGQRQRVAIARALVNSPNCVLMDEPTGNLDQQTAATIHDLISELHQQDDTSFIIVTHDQALADKMQKIYYLQDCHLVTSEAHS